MTIITDAGGLVVSSSDAEFGGSGAVGDAIGATVRQPPSTTTIDRASAPPKADAALRSNAGETFVGLAALLNRQQREFTTGPNATQEYPDEYEITFTPETLKNATLAKSGTTAYNSTAMEDNNKASALDPDKNSTNMKSRSWTIPSGAQIIQVISDIMKNSSYIADQQIKSTDEVTQEIKPNSTSSQENVNWFKVNTMVTPTNNFDKKRNCFAYKITYNISEYRINAMISEYFPGAKYRGAHKAYNYWFTGENTSVLDFSVDYDATYGLYATTSIDGSPSGLRVLQEQSVKNIYGDQFFQPTISTQSTSGSSAQGAKGKANEGAASAEDFLFDPNALLNVKLTIVGDPAYIKQGLGITSNKPNTNEPFTPEGSINFDAGEIVFTMAWNNPTDYNLDTGLMNINQVGNNPDGTPKNLPQTAVAFKAISINSTFSRGKFEQEITGMLIGSLKQLQSPKSNETSGRELINASNGSRNTGNPITDSRNLINSPEQTESPQAATNGDNGTAQITNVLPSALPQPPTSDGEIFDETGLRSNIRRNTETGELFDATGLRTNPQLMNREF
jgi:hypothetical protein